MNNLLRFGIGLLSASVLVAQLPGEKQAGDKTALTSSLTLDEFRSIVQSMGFECKQGAPTQGKPTTFFSYQAEGYKTSAFVQTPDAALLYAGFTDIKVPIDFYNDWNRSNRFSRAYLDSDGNAAIESDVIVAHGVTRENIEAQIKEFRDTVVKFVRAALDREEKLKAPKQ